MSSLPHDETTIDRLCEHAIRGLDAPSELNADDAALLEQFEFAAAALSVALSRDDEPMPASLRSKLSRAASEFNRERAPELKISGTPADAPSKGGYGALAALGWLAAAACLTLAVFAWNSRPSAGLTTPSLAAQYDELSARPGVVRASWVGLDDLLGVPAHAYDDELAGEVIWDHETQTGFMKFTGLAANNPDEFQYQLWIFDAERRVGDLPQFAIDGLPDLLTQRPVDGGVFDADNARSNTGEIIIPIDAKLPVGNAAIFAITVEPPGGVVVSDRDIVTAAVAG
ncbi:MAG: anti-sigma factor [Phycisphaerales bacterium]